MKRLITIVAVAGLSVACGSKQRPKVTEIESIITDDLSTGVTRIELRYDGDQVDEVFFSSDGVDISRALPKYGGDTIKTVEIVDMDGDAIMTLNLDYASGTVAQIRELDPSGDSLRRDYAYESGRVTKISYTDFETNPITEAVVTTTWSEVFRYDKENRIDRITLEGLGDPQIQTLSWDSTAGTLKSITSNISGTETTESFAYDEENRISGVTASDLSRYEIIYSDDGYIAEVVRTLDDLEVKTRYYYDDGSVAGILPSPSIPAQMFFDIQGHIVDELDFVNFELWE